LLALLMVFSLVRIKLIPGNKFIINSLCSEFGAACRHRIGKMKFKVTNWAEYEAGLRRRR
jgi:hypothetical protein